MQNIWTFQYEPISLSDMVLTDNKRNTLQKVLDELPNTLIAGKPGTGKGTFMNILLKETGVDCLKINGSDETGVDMVRDKIKSFATAYSLNKKIVYVNECMDENEYIKTPNGNMQLKDMQYGKEYEVMSFNIKSHEIEIDKATKVSDNYDDIYEVMFDDGRTVNINMEHKFLVYVDGKIECKKLKDLHEGDDIIS